MKIEFGEETLGDDAAGDYITLEGRTHRRAVQTDPLFRAANEFTGARGNVRNEISFTIDKEHADLKAAVDYLAGFPDSLTGQAELRITQDSSAWSMADAALASAQLAELTGQSTKFRFEFTGGAITQSA